METRTLPATTAAEAYLALLKARGVDYLFANAGTDFPSIIEALARQPESGLDFPQAMVVPHENAAVAMAHAYYMITGKPQAVMVHVNVGTANAICQLINASRENVPIFMTAGRTAILEEGRLGSRDAFIHWGQEMFDQAGMVREIVKWDYEMRDGRQVLTVVDRAMAIAMDEPRGPIYLTLPREALADEVKDFKFPVSPRVHSGTISYPDPAAIEEAADILAQADFPLIITSRAGRETAVFELLGEFAERFAIPVVEYRANYNSLPTSHPMHWGYAFGPWLKDVDAALILDTAVPWIPAHDPISADCPVIQMGPDPLFRNYPIRSFPAELAITTQTSVGLRALHAAMEQATKNKHPAIDARRKRLAATHDDQVAARRAGLNGGTPPATMTGPWVSHCINEAKDDDTLVINELGMTPGLVDFPKAGTYFGNSTAGGLGWGHPAALGAKLAAPDKLVISTVGDGSYMFGNPVACHQVAQAQDLPFLTIVFNNGIWSAVKSSTRAMFPDGYALRSNQVPLTSLQPSPAYEKIVEASGGYGEAVTDPAALPDALQRALKAVREEGRQALLNVHYQGGEQIRVQGD